MLSKKMFVVILDLIEIMLSLFLLTINSLKLSIPIVSLYGSAPTYFLLWSLLKTVTSLFPSSNIYRISDDYLYSIYQRFVLFFFQNCLSVKVFLHGDYQQIFNRKENVLYLSNHQSSGWCLSFRDESY